MKHAWQGLFQRLLYETTSLALLPANTLCIKPNTTAWYALQVDLCAYRKVFCCMYMYASRIRLA
jgi:hypothetical protein